MVDTIERVAREAAREYNAMLGEPMSCEQYDSLKAIIARHIREAGLCAPGVSVGVYRETLALLDETRAALKASENDVRRLALKLGDAERRQVAEASEADRAAAREWLNGQRLNKTPHIPEVDSLAAFRAAAREEVIKSIGAIAIEDRKRIDILGEQIDRAIEYKKRAKAAETEVAKLRENLTIAHRTDEIDSLERERDAAQAKLERAESLLELAWGVIANAGNPQGDWKSMSYDWQSAAERWRDSWFGGLSAIPLPALEAEPVEGQK